MHLRSDGGTDRGLVRLRNEDALLVAADLGLFAVCDGVGGRIAGERASAAAVAAIEAAVRADLPALLSRPAASRRADLEALLLAAIERANQAIRGIAAAEPALEGLSTTVAALLVVDETAIVAHVGDSRVYRRRGGEVRQLTVDHTIGALRRGGREAPVGEPRRSGNIFRALGMRDEVKVDVTGVDVEVGDRFLLCTDGLHTYLADDAAIAALIDDAIEAVVPRAIAHARASGGADNITAVIVACEP